MLAMLTATYALLPAGTDFAAILLVDLMDLGYVPVPGSGGLVAHRSDLMILASGKAAEGPVFRATFDPVLNTHTCRRLPTTCPAVRKLPIKAARHFAIETLKTRGMVGAGTGAV